MMTDSKNLNRNRLRQKVKLQDLTQDLHVELLNVAPPVEPAPPLQRTFNPLKLIAWVVLLSLLVIAILPAVGRGWLLFQYQLSFYISQGFFGLGVVLAVLAVLGSLYVIIFK